MRSSATARGLLVGVIGTVVLTVVERLESRALGGRSPLYSAAQIGQRWTRGRAPPHRTARRGARLGLALRWCYGPALGVAFVRVRSRLPRSRVAAGALLGTAIFALEILAMPAVGATPPLRKWSPPERVLLLVHTSAFGIATAYAERAVEGDRSRLA